ncbi:MAG: hypothetical protein Q9165_001208 [Trypethelium subeluteriae]
MPSSSPLQLFPSPPKEPTRKLSLDIQRALSSGRPRNAPQSATTPSKSSELQQVVIEVTADSASSTKQEHPEIIDVAFPPRTSSLKHSAELIRRRISDEIARQENSESPPRSSTPPRSKTPPSARTSPRNQRKREATPERSCITPPPKAYTPDRKASLRRTGESPTSSPQKKTVAFSPVVSDMDTPSRERADSLTGEPVVRRAASVRSKGKSPIEGPHAMTADSAISPSAPRRTGSQRAKTTSPVSTRSRNVALSPAFSDIPSVSSMSPTLVRDNSAINTPLSPEGIPMRSIFPTYDASKPLAQQHYQPMHLPPQTVPRQAVSKAPYSPEVSKTNPTPVPSASASASLPLLWDAANGQDTKGCLRTFNLPLHRPSPAPSKSKSPFSSSSSTSSSDSTTITFGPSPKDTFYSITHTRSAPTSTPLPAGPPVSQIALNRHDPHVPYAVPVTNLSLATTAPSFCPGGSDALLTHIQPKLAALLALDVAAQTPEACALAQVDPNAESAQAAQMAERAVQGAWEREGCALVYHPRGASGVGGAQGSYAIRHPRLGVFPIEVRGDVSSLFAAEKPVASEVVAGAGQFPFPKAAPVGGSISVLHPVSTRAVPTRLATLDVGGRVENLMLDVAQMMQLDSLYAIDVCVSAIMGVAVAEQRRKEALTFAPPPGVAMQEEKAEEGKSRRWFAGRKEKKTKGEKRGKGKGKGKMSDIEAVTTGREDEDELPKLTKGLLQTLFIGFGAVVWILGVGVKVVAGMVVAGSMLAKKM